MEATEGQKEEFKYEYEGLEEEIDYIQNNIPTCEAFDDRSVRISIFHTMLKNWELKL